ncbi:MAG: pitrilysin family protein [Pseudomonadota bacterium]
MSVLTKLDNGLTVVTDRMEGIDSAALGIWVGAGSRCEKGDEHGLAHFLEHMAFKGTRRRSARQISEAIESVGGEINAATSTETTAYHARVLAEDVPLALDILSDIVSDPLFDGADVKLEQNVVLQEIRAAEDVPEDRAFDAFPEAAFAEQPFGRRILGTRSSVGAIGPASLRTFFDRHYAPQNMVVAAAGAVDHDAFVASAEEALARTLDIDAGELPAATYTGGTFTEPDANSDAQWLLGLEGVCASSREALLAQVAAIVLGGGMSSRLFQSLREERGLVYDTSAFHWPFKETGLFGVHFATSPESVDTAQTVVLDTLAAMARTVGDEECARAKAQLRAGLLMARESCSSRMAQAARSVMVHGRVVSKDERIRELNEISAADVSSFVERLVAGTPTMVAIGADADAARMAFGAAFGGGALRGAA